MKESRNRCRQSVSALALLALNGPAPVNALGKPTLAMRARRPRYLVALLLLPALWQLKTAGAEEIPSRFPEDDPVQTPDLRWQPARFEPLHAEPVRYIDYESGSDSNPGTREKPWKHHPWDANAKLGAKASKGIATYVFKQGVVYRGKLVASQSGTKDNPIRLTIDPNWGDGQAVLTGAERLPNDWALCTGKTAERLPAVSRGRTYCASIPGTSRVHRLWTAEDTVLPLVPARIPNWDRGSFPDPRAEWPELERVELEMEIGLSSTDGIKAGDELYPVQSLASLRAGKGRQALRLRVQSVSRRSVIAFTETWPKGGLKNGERLTNGSVTPTVTSTSGTHTLVRRLVNREILGNPELRDLSGAIVRVERPSTQQLTTAPVLGNDPASGMLRANLRLAATRGPQSGDRFYVEGAPELLDQPGEFAAAAHAGGHILYLRLPDDRNPNDTAVETPIRPSIIEIRNQRHIEISGLSFRFVGLPEPEGRDARHTALRSAALQIRGSASHISVRHCRFGHLETGIVAYPLEQGKHQVLDHLVVTDNQFGDIDGSAIIMGSGVDRVSHRRKGRLIHATILRNRLQSVGLLSSSHWGQGSEGHGIDVRGAEVVEVAHNHTRMTGGAGINVYLGSSHGDSGVAQPFLRGQIHNNKVAHSLLAAQDFGGIESWNIGPMYLYNNISANPVGYRHGRHARQEQADTFKRGSYGVGIYLDSQYKAYVFNNVVWGYNNDSSTRIYNAAAFNEAMGFLNTVFNNTFARFAVGIHKGAAAQHNRNSYLGNLLLDMGDYFLLQEPRENIEYESLAYAGNVFQGNPKYFARLGRTPRPTKQLAQWRTFLESQDVMVAQTGVYADKAVVRDLDARDFRLSSGSPAVDKGVKVFVPWALARVVGEWHFYRSAVTPHQIRDESVNRNSAWLNSFMYHEVPRADLKCPNSAREDYIDGLLENWVPGALRFDGGDQFCHIADADMKAGFEWRNPKTKESGWISGEARDSVDVDTENLLIEAVLSVKPDGTRSGLLSKRGRSGYQLDISEQGALQLVLASEDDEFQASSTSTINDGRWHHIIVEVDRTPAKSVRFYIDGALDSSRPVPDRFTQASFANQADFYVAKSSSGAFGGALDFLRVAKSTLAEAETGIEELYEWQFNGPHLHDFFGRPRVGTSPDAGAVELED